jgi:hypothetical protein
MSSTTAGGKSEDADLGSSGKERDAAPVVAPIPLIKPESISMENLKSLAEAKSKIITLSREDSATRLSRSGSWPPVAITWKPEMAPEGSIPISSLIMPAERSSESTAKDKEEEYDELEESDSSVTSASGTISTEDKSSERSGNTQAVVIPPVNVSRTLFPVSDSPADAPPSIVPQEIMTHRASQSQIDKALTLRKAKDLVKWNEEDVGVWLASIGLQGYIDAFQENSVTGADLADLTDDDLADLGVMKIGHKKVLILAIAELLQKSELLFRTPRSILLSPRGGVGAGAGAGGGSNSATPRSPRLVSPQKTSAGSPKRSPRGQINFMSPRPVNALFVKLKYHGKVSVIEVKRSLSYNDLVNYCSNKLGKRVKTIHYVDPDGEPILLKGEKEFRFLIDQNVGVNFSIVVNRIKQKGSSIRRKENPKNSI